MCSVSIQEALPDAENPARTWGCVDLSLSTSGAALMLSCVSDGSSDMAHFPGKDLPQV